MKFLAIALLLALAGCEDGQVVLTAKERAAVKLKTEKRNLEWTSLFIACMQMAAKMPRQSDDDVSDIVQECNYVSYSMSRYIK